MDYIKSRSSKLIVEYLGDYFEIDICSFKNCNIGRIVNKHTSEFKVNLNSNLLNNKRNLTIIDRKFRKHKNYNWNEKWYKYHCNKCGNEDWLIEGSMMKGCGCNACGLGFKKPKLGINTIWDTDRWMCDLGVSEEDAKKYTRSSSEKIEVLCPDCGCVKMSCIYNILETKSIGCACGDGKSYPEKFVFSLLKQLGVEFETEKVFDWSGKKRYDFYIPSNNTIIEVHGRQHYKFISRNGSRTLREEQDNDSYKKDSALTKGVEYYIEIDARESDVEFIKNNILNSELNNLFDLSKVDWLKCEEFALSNRVKEVCDYWNKKEEWESTADLSKIFKLDKCSITKYIKKGTKLGWCNYDPKEEYGKGIKKIGKSGKRVEIFKNGLSLGVFPSCAELERQSEELFGVKLNSKNITKVCRGDNKTYKGYRFAYI